MAIYSAHQFYIQVAIYSAHQFYIQVAIYSLLQCGMPNTDIQVAIYMSTTSRISDVEYMRLLGPGGQMQQGEQQLPYGGVTCRQYIELPLVMSIGPRAVQAQRRSMAPNTPLDF